jgi:hypothetical protein
LVDTGVVARDVLLLLLLFADCNELGTALMDGVRLEGVDELLTFLAADDDGRLMRRLEREFNAWGVFFHK